MIVTGHRVSELRAGIHRLEELDGPRLLCQYVVKGEASTLVVDAGLPTSPRSRLLPLLRDLGADRSPVVLVLTHPDADHCGGASVLRASLSRLSIVAHVADSRLIGNPDRTLAERYCAFEALDGIGPSTDRTDALRARLGAPFALDRLLEGDAAFDLGDRSAVALHVPGHSPGHLAVWLPEERVAIVGDAVMGHGIPRVDRGLLYPPMYSPPAAYRATIDRLEALAPALVLCGHEPPLEGHEALAFLSESRAAAARLEMLVRERLVSGPSVTVAQLCSAVAELYGELPAQSARDFAMTVDGVLGELVAQGGASVEPGPPRRFTAGEDLQ